MPCLNTSGLGEVIGSGFSQFSKELSTSFLSQGQNCFKKTSLFKHLIPRILLQKQFVFFFLSFFFFFTAFMLGNPVCERNGSNATHQIFKCYNRRVSGEVGGVGVYVQACTQRHQDFFQQLSEVSSGLLVLLFIHCLIYDFIIYSLIF